LIAKGKLICFIGIDGSGKTTLARDVVKYINNTNSSAKYVYGRFQLYLAKPVVLLGNKLLLRKVNINDDYIKYTSKKKILFANNKILSNIYLYFLLLDYLLQLIIKVKIPYFLGNTIICDRYIYDTIVTDFSVDMDLNADNLKHLINMCFIFVPKPSMAFLIDIPEDVAFNRKDDVPSLFYLKDRRAIYNELAKYYDMQILNGNKSREEVLSDCIERLKDEFEFL